MVEPKPFIRLALRVEGTMWNAYSAPMDTMEGANLIGSIAMVAVENNFAIKQAFMEIMRMVMSQVIKDATNIEVYHWGDPVIAPERERGGNT